MSAMIDRYNESSKPRPKDAREIPDKKVNVIDTNNEFQKQFETNPQLKKTTFTDKAMEYYNEEVATMAIPETFVPIEPGINLNRWKQETPYGASGTPQT